MGSRTIDSNEYPYLEGVPGEKVEGLDHKNRVGIDGTETRLLGMRAPESQLVTIKTFADAAAALNHATVEVALVGETVDIEDAFGRLHECEILDARQELKSCRCPVGPGVAETDTVMQTTTWRVRKIV